MSLSYLVFNFEGTLPSEELMNSPDYKPPALGDVSGVRTRVSDFLTNIRWNLNSLAGYIVERGCLIELYIAPDDNGLVYSIEVLPYGAIDAEPILKTFCTPNKWHIFSSLTGQWIEPLPY